MVFFVRAMGSFGSHVVDFFADGYAPEVFPTPSRGTGDALAAAASRFTGIFAPVIAVRWSLQSVLRALIENLKGLFESC